MSKIIMASRKVKCQKLSLVKPSTESHQSSFQRIHMSSQRSKQLSDLLRAAWLKGRQSLPCSQSSGAPPSTASKKSERHVSKLPRRASQSQCSRKPTRSDHTSINYENFKLNLRIGAMPSNVRVAVRVRPMLQHEREAGHKQTYLRVDSGTSQIQ